jgi:hypothetical protein
MYFFLRDASQKFRFFSSAPADRIPVQFSKSRKIWEAAKKKLLLLPARTIYQEQAFIDVLKSDEDPARIAYGDSHPEKRIKLRFYFFLQRQRTRHIAFLIGETLLLPLSGLAMLLPGPNVFFGALALLMFTHWKALKGIGRLSRLRHEFIPSPPISAWEQAVESGLESGFELLLKRLEEELHLPHPDESLWNKKPRRAARN